MLDVSTSTANTKAPFIISEDKELHVQYGTIRSGLVFPITAFKPEHTADVGLQRRRGGTSTVRRTGARTNGSPTVNDFQIISTNAADIEPQPITWLWRNRFPQGMITLLGGEGGTLKSTITSAIATPISLGGEWPHGEGRAPLGRTLIISAEDDPASVIVPRLVANGADRSKIEIIGGILRKSTEVKGAFSIQPEHLAALDSFIRRLGDVRLVIIDPIASYIGSGVDTYKNSEVRSVLDPFAAMAARMGFAVIAITHTAKGKVAGKARFIDSVAFVNVARVAYFADENPAVRGGRMLTLQKNNIIPDGVPILTYHGENVETPNNDGELFSAARIVWDAPGNAGEAMQPPITNTRPRTHDKAIALIQEALKDGCRPMKEVMLLGVDQGISGRAMARAKDSLGVTSLHQTRHWEWCPPNT